MCLLQSFITMDIIDLYSVKHHQNSSEVMLQFIKI